PFLRCPTRPSGMDSRQRAARCPESSRVPRRPTDTTSAIVKPRTRDERFVKAARGSLDWIGIELQFASEAVAISPEAAAAIRQLAQGMSRGAASICFSKRTSFQSPGLLVKAKPDLRARLIMTSLERSVSPNRRLAPNAAARHSMFPSNAEP